jgi:hypothetical protein
MIKHVVSLTMYQILGNKWHVDPGDILRDKTTLFWVIDLIHANFFEANSFDEPLPTCCSLL